MSAEAILEYPALFSGRGSIPAAQLAAEYLELVETKLPSLSASVLASCPPSSSRKTLQVEPVGRSYIKAHLFTMLHRHLQKNPDILAQMQKANTMKTYHEVVDAIAARTAAAPTDAHWASGAYYSRHRHLQPPPKSKNLPFCQTSSSTAATLS
eukprot:GHVT01062167.1.p2 GENE.GHVT01062167.1~~GHVT01062167.1.p2  ORF type:complete len:153 (+),score=28.57 GHVT01062167.1:1330-1788(+)